MSNVVRETDDRNTEASEGERFLPNECNFPQVLGSAPAGGDEYIY